MNKCDKNLTKIEQNWNKSEKYMLKNYGRNQFALSKNRILDKD